MIEHQASSSSQNMDNLQGNVFHGLIEATIFEDIGKGRQAAVLVDSKGGFIPIVRTTTAYRNPAQQFQPIHFDIINIIKQIGNPSLSKLQFNNALVEIYDSQYRTMKFHSDQALDLADDSFICIFSCYENPRNPNRKLQICNKTSQELSEICLDHNSVILFSISTNSHHLHKIVIDENTDSNNRWLGITFRLSKTYIRFENYLPIIHFPPISAGGDGSVCNDSSRNCDYLNRELRLATSDESKQFIRMRGEENRSVNFSYPFLDYTISPSDRIPPSVRS